MSDLYDIASITKVAATTLGLMKMEESKLLDLDQRVKELLPQKGKAAYADARLRDVFTHQAGLKSWIPFYKYTLEKTQRNVYSKTRSATHPTKIAEGMYLHSAWQDSIWNRIDNHPLSDNKKYVYSDLGFILAKEIIEKTYNTSLNKYCDENFYQSLGLANLGFLPKERIGQHRLIPSEKDNYWRNQTVKGDVHDMAAAMLGGVAGHAGLFSNANELAVIFQMLLNGGSYGGTRYLEEETIKKWSKKHSSKSRRALGFDRPDPTAKGGGPCAAAASERTFGHTGFTGTCAWADPDHDLIYIFLSNRTYPDMNNWKLVKENIRTRIQELVYQALPTP